MSILREEESFLLQLLDLDADPRGHALFQLRRPKLDGEERQELRLFGAAA